MLQGYRGWKIKRVNGRMTLVSPMNRYHWSRDESTAFCSTCSKLVTLYGPFEMLRTDVAESCTCGIYALKTPEAVVEYFGGGGIDVVGRVLLYGTRVIEGEHGYRAEKAKIDMLLMPTMRKIPPGEIEELAREYGVHLVVARGGLREKLERQRKQQFRVSYYSSRTSVLNAMKARYPYMFEEERPAVDVDEESVRLDSLEQRVQRLELTMRMLRRKYSIWSSESDL